MRTHVVQVCDRNGPATLTGRPCARNTGRTPIGPAEAVPAVLIGRYRIAGCPVVAGMTTLSAGMKKGRRDSHPAALIKQSKLLWSARLDYRLPPVVESPLNVTRPLLVLTTVPRSEPPTL